MDEFCELLGLDGMARGIGALFALLAIGIIVVVFLAASSGGSGGSSTPRLVQGSGEIIGSSFVCHMHSGANHNAGQRELQLRVPCEQADSEAARYPTRQFHTQHVEMLRIAYVNDRGKAVDGIARRDTLNVKGPVDVGQHVTFYFDPSNPKRELAGTPSTRSGTSGTSSGTWFLGAAVLTAFAFTFLAMIICFMTGFTVLSWLFSLRASD